jgi:PAS domain S-box-containing protein
MTKASDMKKTKAELVEELQELRRRVAKLEGQLDKCREAEESPTQEQLLLRALMDSTPDHIYFKDIDSRFITASRSQTDRFGLDDPADVVGKTDFDFFTDEHAQPAYEDEQIIIRTGEPVVGLEEKETWPDGSVSWVSTNKMPLRAETGEIVGTFGISSDVTARKEAEMALERRSVQLQTAAEVSGAVSSVLDLDKLTQMVVAV